MVGRIVAYPVAARVRMPLATRSWTAWWRRPAAAALPHALVLLPIQVLAAAGCIQYVPVDAGTVRPDEEVRVRVTENTAVRLVSELGRITPELEGSVAPQGSDSVAVSLWIGREYRGTPFENVRRTVALDRLEITEVRRRQISVARSTLAAAGVATVFAVLINRLTHQENPNPSDNGTDPPPPPGGAVLRIPLGGSR